MSENTTSVRYIGHKPKCTDSFPNGKVYTWFGNGDVQDLPAAAMPKVIKHPTVWEVLAAQPQPGLADASVHGGQTQPVTPADDLSTMNVAQLREWAKANGKKIDGRLKDPDAIRALLTAE